MIICCYSKALRSKALKSNGVTFIETTLSQRKNIKMQVDTEKKELSELKQVWSPERKCKEDFKIRMYEAKRGQL